MNYYWLILRSIYFKLNNIIFLVSYKNNINIVQRTKKGTLTNKEIYIYINLIVK